MIKTRPLLQNFSVLGLGCLLLGALSGATLADSDDGPGPESRQSLLRPIGVVSTSGDVQNAEALVTDHQGCATLTMVQGGATPMIILDYGRDVGGLLSFTSPQFPARQSFRLSTANRSNTCCLRAMVPLLFRMPRGDTSRVDTYAVSGPGLIINRMIQGGEPFQAITLTAPGSVTLNRVGIRAKFFRPQPTANRGSFRSSDPQLNEIWDLGASTLQLCQVPARSTPAFWTVTARGLDVTDSPVALYQGGGPWADYTVIFGSQVIANEAAWVVRDNGLLGYEMVLDTDDDALNQPNALRVFSVGLFGSTPVATVPLAPFGIDLKVRTWHTVKTVAVGGQVSVFIDDKPITFFNVPTTGFPSAATGSFGFTNANGAEAQFRNLSVTAASGQTLYASPLNDPSVLVAFAAGTNPLPVIVDGAKRDRLTFAGDLVLAAPTVYYSSGTSDYVAGLLTLFASFQNSSGEVSNILTPLLNPGSVPADDLAGIQGGFYSLSYSIHFINALYDYYLYTGDFGLVAHEWPVVEKEFTYLSSTTNPPQSHLVTTNPINGMDWNVNTLTGTVTEYNVLYYRALNNAAAMANAIGHQNEAVNFRLLASQVKSEINKTLFNGKLYNVSNIDQTTVAQDANALAVLYGVAPLSGAPSILQTMEMALQTPNGPLAFSGGSGDIISPFISGFDVYAHFAVGDAAGALALIRTVWGLHMTHDKPFYSGGVFEKLAEDGTLPAQNTSLAHGWSSGPTSALSKYVLGVRPVEPGYRAWLIEPQIGDLTWAKGTAPTPHGPIAVAWQKTSQGFRLEIDVPAGTNGTVGVPTSSSTDAVTDNGRPIQKDGKMRATSVSDDSGGARMGYAYFSNLGPGAHVIQVTGGKK